MDDQQKSTTQNPTANPATEVAADNVNPVSGQTQVESQPISTGGPERQSAYSSEALPEVRTELKEIGVEAVSELPPLDKDHEQIGDKYSPQSTPVPKEPSGAVKKFPMSEQEAIEEVAKDKGKVSLDVTEHGDDSAYVVSSRFFLATLVLKIIKNLRSLGRK